MDATNQDGLTDCPPMDDQVMDVSMDCQQTVGLAKDVLTDCLSMDDWEKDD